MYLTQIESKNPLSSDAYVHTKQTLNVVGNRKSIRHKEHIIFIVMQKTVGENEPQPNLHFLDYLYYCVSRFIFARHERAKLTGGAFVLMIYVFSSFSTFRSMQSYCLSITAMSFDMNFFRSKHFGVIFATWQFLSISVISISNFK